MLTIWKIPLTFLCTVALSSFSLFEVTEAIQSSWDYDTHPIINVLSRKPHHNKRVLTLEDGVCTLEDDTPAGAMFLHFTGIFFQNFLTGGGNDILGPLAVGGNFTAPNYIVNANRGHNCAADPRTSVQSIGLVVKGLISTIGTQVHGDVLSAGGGDLSEIKELNSAAGCDVYDNIGTGAFDFDVAENSALRASAILAASLPNMYMDASGVILDLGSDDSNYKIFTFNTCNDGNCNVGGVLSDPDAIFLGRGNFNGPSGDVPNETDTVVFNIPVTEGSTIDLLSSQPSKGFYACRTIYNFYPVDSEGIYNPKGEITVIRNTGGQIEGFTLAPRAHILDGRTGAFAGTIIGLDYDWFYGIQGVQLHDYNAADDHCGDFAGCFPLEVEFPETTTTSDEPSTILSTTETTEVITTITTDEGDPLTISTDIPETITSTYITTETDTIITEDSSGDPVTSVETETKTETTELTTSIPSIITSTSDSTFTTTSTATITTVIPVPPSTTSSSSTTVQSTPYITTTTTVYGTTVTAETITSIIYAYPEVFNKGKGKYEWSHKNKNEWSHKNKNEWDSHIYEAQDWGKS